MEAGSVAGSQMLDGAAERRPQNQSLLVSVPFHGPAGSVAGSQMLEFISLKRGPSLSREGRRGNSSLSREGPAARYKTPRYGLPLRVGWYPTHRW